MFNIKLEIDEKQLEQAIIEVGMEAGKSEIQTIMASIKCPEHGEYPQNIHFESGDILKFDVCCEKLDKAIKDTLS